MKRSDFELFCTYPEGGITPPTSVSHTCDVPTDRSGYHLILGTWDVSHTTNAFYQVIDVNLINNGTGPQLPSTPGNITSIVQTLNSITLNWSASNASAGISYYEVFHNGALVGSPIQPTFVESKLIDTQTTLLLYKGKVVFIKSNPSSTDWRM